MKPIEEVIDVVGDFGPGPTKQDENRFEADENFGMAFDVSALEGDQLQMQMPDQAMMMPPQPGKENF